MDTQPDSDPAIQMHDVLTAPLSDVMLSAAEIPDGVLLETLRTMRERNPLGGLTRILEAEATRRHLVIA